MDEKKNDNKKDDEKDVQNRISIINEIFNRFQIATPSGYDEDFISKFKKKRELEIEDIKEIFPDLKSNEIAYILNTFLLSNERKIEIIINFLDTLNSILAHFTYYKTKSQLIKYNNSHFDNYLLKRYECSYIFTTFLSSSRELKIDNKLFFNYIPIKCISKLHKENTEERVNCGFSHNHMELFFHPFVYKKFKCRQKDCKKDSECGFYHSNNDGDALDMETEVDFDSNEIINLVKILSTLSINKKDEKNNKIINSEKNKKNNFIPTEFNPSTYKRYRCPLGPICKLDNKLCLNYHGAKDKRRNPELYEAKLCPNLYENNKRKKDGKCEFGDACDKSHNLFEFYYHPSKFRKVKCPNENKNKYCKERLICPYIHKSDSDCGEPGEKMILDPKLISNYYKSLMVNYEKSIDEETKKLIDIKKRYICSKCKIENVLEHEKFFVDINENKIVCNNCADEKDENYKEIDW